MSYYGVYLCCVVEEVEDVSGCPVCGCHESHRMVEGEKPDYIRYTPPSGVNASTAKDEGC